MYILISLIYILVKKAKSEDILERYLYFIMITSFAFVFIFKIEIEILWITLICAIGLLLHAKSPIKNKVILLVFAVFVFAVFRVPTHPSAEFEQYLIDKHGIYCSALDCVEVVEVEDEDMRQMQTTKYAIQGLSSDWYFIYARNELVLDNKTIKVINIAGFWIQLNN